MNGDIADFGWETKDGGIYVTKTGKLIGMMSSAELAARVCEDHAAMLDIRAKLRAQLFPQQAEER